jgi:hypothetical protein
MRSAGEDGVVVVDVPFALDPDPGVADSSALCAWFDIENHNVRSGSKCMTSWVAGWLN